MSLTKMIIPKTITVGYQNRDSTYTGKLAYVIYTDNKGKLRKEPSWNSWRDKKIKSNVYDNTPTSGFVLNKGVGGTRESYGWNARNEYIRIYDPRGFEFEISVANLLFILQECTSTKGKGLEGEFVYSWDGADLVLLPECSQEYKECFEFTENQSKKITKKDMVEGCTYLMKNGDEVMYLGRHEYFNFGWNYKEDETYREYCVLKTVKRHIFIDTKQTDEDSRYYQREQGFTKLAIKTSEEALSQYAGEYDRFKESIHGSQVVKIKIVKTKIVLTRYRDTTALIKEGDHFYRVLIECNWANEEYEVYKNDQPFYPKIVKGRCEFPEIDRYRHDYYRTQQKPKTITKEAVLKLKFYTIIIITEKGSEYEMLNNNRRYR